MKHNLLKAKIVEKGYSVEKVADKANINRATLYRKLNNFEKITIGEAKRIKSALGLTSKEATEIFLA